MPRKKATRSSRAVPVHLARRVDELRQRVRQAGASALLVTNPVDIRYLTGFVGDDSWALIPAKAGRATILSDARFEEQIQREAPHARAVMRGNQRLHEVLPQVLPGRAGKLALQPDHVSIRQRGNLARSLGARRLMELDDRLLEQRSIKDEGEVACIRRALAIQQKAYEKTLEYVQPGMTERQVAAYLEFQMRDMGADGPSFPSIVAAGANASLPHAIPGEARVKKNQIILIDWGARWGGYCSDMTRVVAVGKMPAKIREIYEVVLEAQLAGIAAIGPGVPCRTVDSAAREVIRKAGYGKEFGHGLGHGLGLNIHEHPRLNQIANEVLAPGQVVTVEPGIYLPGVGGVRIEDDVLVTDRGAKVLSHLPKGLDSAMI